MFSSLLFSTVLCIFSTFCSTCWKKKRKTKLVNNQSPCASTWKICLQTYNREHMKLFKCIMWSLWMSELCAQSAASPWERWILPCPLQSAQTQTLSEPIAALRLSHQHGFVSVPGLKPNFEPADTVAPKRKKRKMRMEILKNKEVLCLLCCALRKGHRSWMMAIGGTFGSFSFLFFYWFSKHSTSLSLPHSPHIETPYTSSYLHTPAHTN